MVSRFSRMALLAACAAFLAANLIHNSGGIDPAIAPGGIFTALLFWKPRRLFLTLATIALAVPALLFFKPSALTELSRQGYFFNHLFLLLTAVLATGALASGLLPNRAASTRMTAQEHA
ncbi:MAG: hypothetical protein ACT4P6_20510 [Gemmatimonadaceae bacterium]